MRSNDIDNFLHLKMLVEKYGWPDFRKVGVYAAGIANMILLHGARYYSLESEEWIFFEKEIIKEIFSGDFYPVTLAQWTDQHLILVEKKPQKYGSVANENGQLFPVLNISSVDSLRAGLLLEPLNDYIEKKGYKLQYEDSIHYFR
jgi:hypothetical protein